MAKQLTAVVIPQVTPNPISETGADPCPYIADDKFVNGIWVRNSDGEEYALCIHPPDGYNQTHTARNSVHQWQGRAEQFHADFQRK